MIIRRTLFNANLADNFGGAIAQSEASDVTVFDSTFSVNESGGSGGAVALVGSPNANLQIYNTTIAQNTSNVDGGGVFVFFNNAPANERNTVKIRNTMLVGNFAPESSELHFTGETFAGNISLDHNLLGSGRVTYGSTTNTLKFLPVSITNSRILTSDFEDVPDQSSAC